jgi:histidinol-phosphate aminotransferase
MSRALRTPLRPEMAEVPAYVTSTKDAPVRLDRNESPEEMPERLREQVLARLASTKWSRYPDPYASELKEALAKRERLPAEQVIVGDGSNSLFLSFFLASGAPGRRIALCPPTFGLYASWAKAAGAAIESFPLDEEDLSPPVERMLSEAKRDPDLLFVLCSPNNPTGTLFPRGGLIPLLETGAFVLMDEAYIEFVEGDGRAGGASPDLTTPGAGASARGLLSRFPNLVISRTLSKAAALAGVRVGYMLGDPALLREVEKVVPPFSVNLFARLAALAALSDAEATAARVVAIVSERDRMAKALAGSPGGSISESHANFLYLRPDRPAEQLFEALWNRGVLVRKVAGTKAPALRVTVGRPEENDRFLAAWREVTV